MEKNGYSYYAFISYKRDDERWAKWLQRKLENYRLPSVLRKDGSPKNLRPIFRDKTDLGVGVLKESLAKELQKSKYLIVICSPASAKSQWVGAEIEHFISLGRGRQIIPFVVDGEFDSENSENCYLHPVLRNIENELLCIDVRESGKEVALVKVVAGLLDFPFDKLWQRHKRYRLRKHLLRTLFVLVLAFCLLYIVLFVRPLALEVTFCQLPAENTSLPLPDGGGKIALTYGGKTDTVFVSDLHETFRFTEIPGKFRNSKVSLHFEMQGFETKDTAFDFTGSCVLPVYRDKTYAVVSGTVENTVGETQPGLRIEILDYECLTDENGCFEIEIPLKDQRKEYVVSVFRNSEKISEQKVYPISECLLTIK